MFEILLHFTEVNNWEEAFNRAIPKRKIVDTVHEEINNDQDIEDSNTVSKHNSDLSKEVSETVSDHVQTESNSKECHREGEDEDSGEIDKL